MVSNPKVFISYSHDSEEHKKWVLNLATHLRNHGVDVILDQWDLRLGGDLAFFMEQGLTQSHMVICVCSENYVDKSDERIGGTGYESAIIRLPLLKNTNTDHIICIVKNNFGENKVPTALSGKMFIDFSDSENYFDKYKELLERIYDKDKSKKPVLGKNPFENELATNILISTELNKMKYANWELSGKVTFDINNNSGEFTIGQGDYEFITSWSSRSPNSIYAYRDHIKKIGYLPSNKKFPSLEELDQFDYSSRSRALKIDEVATLINSFNKFAAIKVIAIEDNNLTFEYKIYEDLTPSS